MDYKETLKYIDKVNWRGSSLGLDRIRTLMELLGNPQKKLKFIHIGGTNGKGSTAAFIAGMLINAGYKTGLFTSPYIEIFNERMQVNAQNISNDELASLTTYVKPYAESMEDKPTEFELYTAVGILYFLKHECDIVVLEVGMGGELDATNVIDAPIVCVLTAIGLDHTKELGDTIEKITQTKSGIIKPGSEVVLYRQGNPVEDVVSEKCRELGDNLNISEPEKIQVKSMDIDSLKFSYGDINDLEIHLVGSYQVQNVALAIKVSEVLNKCGYKISEHNIREGLKTVKWPGRFEVLRKEPLFIVDGAHNPHGIKATSSGIKALFEKELKEGEKFTFIFGVMKDKDYLAMLDEILPMAKRVYCVTPDNPRALNSKELSEIIREKKVDAVACDSIKEAINMSTKDGDTVIAIGSLYMIGTIKTILRGDNK